MSNKIYVIFDAYEEEILDEEFSNFEDAAEFAKEELEYSDDQELLICERIAEVEFDDDAPRPVKITRFDGI